MTGYLGRYLSSKLPTTIYHVKASAKAPLLIFIPGNPGIVDYYIPYLDRVQAATQFEVLCISHICHDSLSIPKSFKNSKVEVFDLETQVLHKLEISKNFIEYVDGDIQGARAAGDRPVILMGHSVGAYMVQRVADLLALESCNVAFTGLLFPTIIDIAKSSHGIKFTRMFNYLPQVYNVAGNLVSWMNKIFPKSVMGYIIRHAVNSNSPSALRGTEKLAFNGEVVRQVLGLAKHEMYSINNDITFNDRFFQLSAQRKYGIWCYFAQNDHWVAEQTKQYLIDRYFSNRDKQKFTYDIDTTGKFTHSFVLDQSEAFAQITIDKLNRFVPIYPTPESSP